MARLGLGIPEGVEPRGLGMQSRVVQMIRDTRMRFSLSLVWCVLGAKPDWKKREVGLGWRFTQGCGLDGLALGYSLAAPPGAPEATRKTGAAALLLSRQLELRSRILIKARGKVEIN